MLHVIVRYYQLGLTTSALTRLVLLRYLSVFGSIHHFLSILQHSRALSALPQYYTCILTEHFLSQLKGFILFSLESFAFLETPDSCSFSLLADYKVHSFISEFTVVLLAKKCFNAVFLSSLSLVLVSLICMLN